MGEVDINHADTHTLPKYMPQFDDSIEKEITLDVTSEKYKKFFAHESKFLADLIRVGSIKFDVELERVKTDHDTHKDLIVHVVCHREGFDPSWRCSFQCEINASFGDINAKATGLKKDAHHKDNSLTMPVLRLPDASVEASLVVNIKMNKWTAIFPRLTYDFTKQHEYTDATLIVDGTRLFITRGILANQSSFFNTMFLDDRFADAAKTEFALDDVSLEDMMLFLNLTYPEHMVGEREEFITTIEILERVLLLSEQFTVPAFKKTAERMLMDASTHFPKVKWIRLLYICDRFRLSEACTAQIRRLRSKSDFIRLRQSEEFDQLSARLRSSLFSLAVDKLPQSINIRTMRVPSRTGRIDAFSDVDVDDDDGTDDIAVLNQTQAPTLTGGPGPLFGYARSPAYTMPAVYTMPPPLPSTTANTGSAVQGGLRSFFRRITAPSPPSRLIGRPPGSSSSSAAVAPDFSFGTAAHAAPSSSSAPAAAAGSSSSTTAAVTSLSSSVAAATSSFDALMSTLIKQRAAQASASEALRPHRGSPASSMYANPESIDSPMKTVKTEQDIKQEEESSEEGNDGDQQPGPSNRPPKRASKPSTGMATRRSKRTKKD